MSGIMNYENHQASVHFSSEDDVFFGKIPGISDLVTFEGKSVKELKSLFREAVEDYIETCAEAGKKPEKTCKGSFNLRLYPFVA